MSFIRKIKRKGRIYLAEVENQRKDGKVRQKFIRYIGTEPSPEKSAFPQSSNDLHIDSVKIHGSVLVLHELAKKIGLDKLLGDHAQSILTLVYAHCHEYKSIRDVSKWFQKTDLSVIFGVKKITEKQLYRALFALEDFDQLSLQKFVYESICKICKESDTSVIYDVTNTYFYGSKCHLSKNGKDKEGVQGRPLIQIGLAVTKKFGIPIFHQVHSSNVSDSKIFSEAIHILGDLGIRHGNIVYDRGMNSKASILKLSNKHWHIIGGMPLHKGIKSEVLKMDLSKVESYRNRIQQGNSIFYSVSRPYSAGTVKGRLHIIINAEKKQHDREKRLKKLFFYKNNDVEVEKSYKKFFTKAGGINSHALQRAEVYDGMSVIFSTGRHSREEIIRLYFEKDLVEKCFQLMKGVLSLRPIRCWLDEKVKAHMMICYLSYALLATFSFMLKNSKLGVSELSVPSALDELEEVYKVYHRGSSGQKDSNQLFFNIISLTSLQEKILKSIIPDFKV